MSAASTTARWIGDPDARIEPENPYLKLAERNVARDLAQTKDGNFWLVWGATAPESGRRGDAELKARALAATDALAAELRGKPEGHWSITVLLECVYLWQKSGEAPAARVAEWLAAARPSVEHNCEVNRRGLAGEPNASWTTFAPNALLQSASMLALAGRLYGEARYTDLAGGLVHAAAGHQRPGGAFSYIHDSSPDSVYYGFETTFLGRYYQLTQNPEARRMLESAAGYAHDALANGPFEGSSSTWWKHAWGSGGPIHGVEIAAGVSRDPVARALAEVRLKAAQPYWFSYVAMYFWDPTIPPAAAGADEVRLSGNINGPLLRRGAWQVVMPFNPRNDTVVGATLIRPDKAYQYENYLESAALPVMLTPSGDYRGRDASLFMIPSDELVRRSSIVGKDWIAAGTVFHPRRGVYGELAIPPSEGWQVAQIWFADVDGLAGWLEAVPDAGTTPAVGTPCGTLNLGAPVEVAEGQSHRYRSSGLSLAFFGEQIAAITTKGKQVTVNLKDPSQGGAYGVSVAHGGEPARIIPRGANPDGLLSVCIKRTGAKDSLLYFNPRPTVASSIAPRDGRLSRPTSTSPIRAGSSFSLQPYEITVLLTN